MHGCAYTVPVTFQWDPAKARANLKKHRVDFADAASVFEAPSALTRDDPHPREERFITLGIDALGRLLVVCWAPRDDELRIISASRANHGWEPSVRKGSLAMRKNYDFSNAKRGPVLAASPGKTRITIRLDDDVLEWFREQTHAAGGGNYQTQINDALRAFVHERKKPLETVLRLSLIHISEPTRPY